MKRLRKLTKLFTKDEPLKNGNGLFATLEELIEQRQYVSHIGHLKPQKTTSQQAGDVKSAFKGRGMELEEIRSYAYGDDVRDIDWRVTARKEQPYTKLYAEERDREVYVLLDLSAHMVFGTRNELKSVSAAKIAALLGWMSLVNKDRFGCMVFDGQRYWLFKPQNSQANMMVILKKIASVSRDVLHKGADGMNLARAVELLQQNIKRQAIVFVVSDFNEFGDDLKKSLAALARKSRVFCVNVFDVLEEKAPKAGEYMAENGGERLIFDTKSKYFQKEYRDYFKVKREGVGRFCREFRAVYMEVRTDMPLYRQLKIR